MLWLGLRAPWFALFSAPSGAGLLVNLLSLHTLFLLPLCHLLQAPKDGKRAPVTTIAGGMPKRAKTKK